MRGISKKVINEKAKKIFDISAQKYRQLKKVDGEKIEIYKGVYNNSIIYRITNKINKNTSKNF